MRYFINLFLLLFLMDGTVSFIDDLLSLLSQTPLLSFIRNPLALLVVIIACPVYLCLGIDKRLPKRHLLPLIVFVYLSFISDWIFPSIAGNRLLGLFISAFQILLAILPYSPFRMEADRKLFLCREQLAGPFFSWKNSAVFLAINILLIPAVLFSIFMASANSYANRYTAGFMRIAPTGIYMSDRTYKNGGKLIRLIAMIHIGEQGYYDDLLKSDLSTRSILLAEGVTDVTGRLEENLGYSKVAGLLGLQSQEKVRFEGRHIEESDLGKPGRKKHYKQRFTPDILRADVDISRFQPGTIIFLNAAGRHLNNNTIPFMEGMAAFNAWANEHMSEEDNRVVMNDIILLRNKVVTGYLDRALMQYDTIIIPWGALHMPEIEQAVIKRGFTLEHNRIHTSVDFWKIIKQKLLR